MGSLLPCTSSPSHKEDSESGVTSAPYRKTNVCSGLVYPEGLIPQEPEWRTPLEPLDPDMPGYISRYKEIPGTFALLIVAAAHTIFAHRSIITFRVMLCVYNSPQAASCDNRTLYYDPDMIEVKRKNVNLCPYLGNMKELRVETELILEKETEWRHKEAFPLKQERNGKGFLLNQSSENLADFSLESEDGASPLSGHIKITFHFSQSSGEIVETLINMDQPSNCSPRHRVSQGQHDLLNEIFIKIAREIGDKSSQLAVCLGVKDYDRHEIASKSQTPFDKNYEMLTHWWKTSPESATVDKLIQVLVDCGRNDLAETTRRKSLEAGHKGSVTSCKSGVIGHKTSARGRKMSGRGRKTSVPGRKASVPGRKFSSSGRKASIPGRKISVPGHKTGAIGHNANVTGSKNGLSDIDNSLENSAVGHRNRLRSQSHLSKPQDTFISEEDENESEGNLTPTKKNFIQEKAADGRDMGNEEPRRIRRPSEKKVLA